MNRTGVSSKILQVGRASPASGGTIMLCKMRDLHNIRIFLAWLDFDKLSRAKAPPIHSFLTAAIVGVELSVHPYSFDRLPSINSGQAGQVGSIPFDFAQDMASRRPDGHRGSSGCRPLHYMDPFKSAYPLKETR